MANSEHIFNEELEFLYMPSNWDKGGHSNIPALLEKHYFNHCTRESEANKRDIEDKILDLPYGDHPRQKLDVFGPNLPDNAPIFVFIHGGYWVAGSRDDSSWMVNPMMSAGIVTAIVGYRLAPEADLDNIVLDVRCALKYLQKHFGRRMWLCGHSAGAHLACAAVVWDNELPGLTIDGLFAVSGVYDLLPLSSTSVATDSGFSKDSMVRNSLITSAKLFKGRSKTGVTMVVGGWESPGGFISQSKLFAEELRSNGVTVRELIIPDENHFSVVEKLSSPKYSLTKEIISSMRSS